ncbi:S1 family peptidase [Cohnella cellulosilytica]|uniref:Serine protease n=1 Tax=Cohnella cellulosilytica TaxID=986710 RepID=A0ABW2FFV9_9BACL
MEKKPDEPVTEDWEWEETEEDSAEEQLAAAARRRRIRNIVASLLAIALIGNVLAFWPQIYNSTTLPFLFKSKELSARENVQSYKEAVVLVSTDKGKGTGFHVNGGYIVTNYHVIEGGAYSAVKFPGNDRAYEASIAGADPDLDIALLKVEESGQSLPSIPVEREWKPGEHVYVIGNPLYFTQIVNEGHVLELVPIRGRDKPALAIDAPVFKGNSGSPVINEEGRAIAVVFATTEIEREEGPAQAGLAVPFADLEELLKAIGY